MSESLQVGQHYKVRLPGESPWAECVAVMSDGTWAGRIDNKLVGSGTDEERRAASRALFGVDEPLKKMHGFKENDVIRFGWQEIADGIHGWCPLEWSMSKQ